MKERDGDRRDAFRPHHLNRLLDILALDGF